MKSLHHYVRSVRRDLVEREGLPVALARDYFFARITAVVLCEMNVLTQHASDSVRLDSDAFDKLLGCVPTYIRRAAALSASRVSIPSEVRATMVSDPTKIGWAYQFWNEAERDESTFAISRQGEQELNHRSLTAATQLFTEDYMSEVLAERCLVQQSGFAQDVLDPACGTGHILVHALRRLRKNDQASDSSAMPLISRIFGCDIDPDAVELCRIILFLEAVKIPTPPQQLPVLWETLTANIQVIASEYGTLDREDPSPLLQRRYGCVLANPPYIGRRKLTDTMRRFLDREYPATSMDLCSAFMQRCMELVEAGGWLGLVTVDKWLRLKGYEALRTGAMGFAGLYGTFTLDLVCELGQRAFGPWSGLHDGVGIALLTAQCKQPEIDHSFHFISCADVVHHEQKAALINEWRLNGGVSSAILQRDVMQEGGSVSFIINHGVPACLINSPMHVRDAAQVVVGLQTGDDRRFVRYVWSVPPDRNRWLVHSKGGGYERWYGLNRYLLDWGAGKPIFDTSRNSGISVAKWFPLQGWTYTWFAHGSLGLRRKDSGWSFGRAAASGVFCEDLRLVGFLNSRIASLVARRIGGKAQLPEGVVRALPIPPSLDGIDAQLVEAAVDLKRAIVERDITDASFRPSSSFEPLELLGLNALLLVVEGELERQVCELLEMDRGTRRSLDDVMGQPVGWNPLTTGIDDDVAWSVVPHRFHVLRTLVSCSLSASLHFKDCLERVRAYFEKGATPSTSGRPLPATSLIEQVCRYSGAHPFDVVKALAILLDSDDHVASEVVGPLLRSRIVEVVLAALGHQWWATTECYDPTLHHIRSTEELAEIVSRALPMAQCERILGVTVKEWIAEKMDSWHNRLFFNEPLLVAESSKAQKGLAFGHRWSVNVYDTLASQERCSR